MTAQNQYSRLVYIFCRFMAAICAPRQSKFRTVPQNHSVARFSFSGCDLTTRAHSFLTSSPYPGPSLVHTRPSSRTTSSDCGGGVRSESFRTICTASSVVAGVFMCVSTNAFSACSPC